MVTELSFDDVHFEPGSVVDLAGKVFHFDGRIFRAINPTHVSFFEELIELGQRSSWSGSGLIPTWRSNYSLPGYPLVLEHKKIPFITLRGEWSGEGLRSAALCILSVIAELSRSNLCLKDAHPWNVLFEGIRPYFIDWGSIAPSAALSWEFWYAQFRQFLLAPLYAFSIGEHRIARAMLREHKVGVGNEIIDQPTTRNLPDIPRHIAESANSSPIQATFEALASYVEGLTIPDVKGEWTEYGQPEFTDLDDRDPLRAKDRIVHRILGENSAETLIDVGTNNGLHSEIAVALGMRVLACDIEETCLNSLYKRAKKRDLDLLPLFHDFLWPIGTSGILNTIPAAEQRLSCDTALVMALTHHLAFKHHVSFEAMARGISALAKRRAIVEFVPAEDEHVALWAPGTLPWYNLDNFMGAMTRYFKNFSIVSSEPKPRCIVVFEK